MDEREKQTWIDKFPGCIIFMIITLIFQSFLLYKYQCVSESLLQDHLCITYAETDSGYMEKVFAQCWQPHSPIARNLRLRGKALDREVFLLLLAAWRAFLGPQWLYSKRSCKMASAFSLVVVFFCCPLVGRPVHLPLSAQTEAEIQGAFTSEPW